MFQSKRRAYDSKAHIVPEEARKVAPSGSSGGSKKGGSKSAAASKMMVAPAAAGPAANQWEAKSSQLRDAMRAAREYKAAVAGGGDGKSLPPMRPSAPDPSLVNCPNCNRNFSATAAERHIPKCATIKSKPSMLMKGSGGNAVTAAVGGGGGSSMRMPTTAGRVSLGGGGGGYTRDLPPVPGMDAYDRHVRPTPRNSAYDDAPVGRASVQQQNSMMGGGTATRNIVRPGGRL